MWIRQRILKSWHCPFTHHRDPTPAPTASAIDTHALSDTENNPYNQHSIYSVKSKYVSVPSEMTTIQFSHSIIAGTEVVQRESIATQTPFLLGFPYYLDYSSPFIRIYTKQPCSIKSRAVFVYAPREPSNPRVLCLLGAERLRRSVRRKNGPPDHFLFPPHPSSAFFPLRMPQTHGS